LLAAVKAQEYLDIMGPLGKGFTLPAKAGTAVLVGGGVGIAPLLYLARRLQEMKCDVTVLYGAGSSKELAPAQRFENLPVQLLTATMDGSEGYKGLVTDLLKEQITPEETDVIYTCGPEIMMAAVADYAVRNNIGGECSLEENMACAVGACLGCARKLKSTDNSYVKVCLDGPVFNLQGIELYNGGLS
jgi:dihydroorotate dehydrogenase electron transfer subunit